MVAYRPGNPRLPHGALSAMSTSQFLEFLQGIPPPSSPTNPGCAWGPFRTFVGGVFRPMMVGTTGTPGPGAFTAPHHQHHRGRETKGRPWGPTMEVDGGTLGRGLSPGAPGEDLGFQEKTLWLPGVPGGPEARAFSLHLACHESLLLESHARSSISFPVVDPRVGTNVHHWEGRLPGMPRGYTRGGL